MSGKIMTTTHVDLDLVLTVAGELPRLAGTLLFRPFTPL